MPTVQTNGIETYYEEYGNGKPIVFLHGAGGDHVLWAELAQPLTDDFRVIVYDLRGHGQTERPDTDSCSIDDFAADLSDLSDALDLHEPIVCGLSLGGMIGYQFAISHSDGLAGLITLGSKAPTTFTLAERTEDIIIQNIAKRFGEYDRVMAGLEWTLQKIHGEEVRADEEKAEEIRDSHSCERTELTEDQKKMLDRVTDSYRTSTPNFQGISVPTLVLFGEYEPWTTNHREFLVSEIPHAEGGVVPDAPHNSHGENPAFILDAIRKFVKERVPDNGTRTTA